MVTPETTITSLDNLSQNSEKLLATLSDSQKAESACILTLTGDLGAGKTTLVQSIAKLLGITEVVTSPTFVVMKRYETEHALFHTLIHIDAYRLESSEEMKPLRFKEVLQEAGTLVCIEWAERIADIIPVDSHRLILSTVDEATRTITYERK